MRERITTSSIGKSARAHVRLFLGVVAAVLSLLCFSGVASAKASTGVGEPIRLEVPGQPDAFYYLSLIHISEPTRPY